MAPAFVQPTPIGAKHAPLTPAQVCGRKSEMPRDATKYVIRSQEKQNNKPKGAPTGLFGRLKEKILRPIVTVPGGGTGGDLLECVFCKGEGYSQCDSCLGSGKDALGQCFMCEGACNIKCTVCNGVGMVDRIRRGGTDDRNEYILKKKKGSKS